MEKLPKKKKKKGKKKKKKKKKNSGKNKAKKIKKIENKSRNNAKFNTTNKFEVTEMTSESYSGILSCRLLQYTCPDCAVWKNTSTVTKYCYFWRGNIKMMQCTLVHCQGSIFKKCCVKRRRYSKYYFGGDC